MHTKLVAGALACVTVLLASPASAEDQSPVGAWEDYPRAPAFEVNVLWPFFPGGIADFRLMLPLVLADRGDFRGELLLGLHSDFGWRSVRAADAGRVAFLGAKIGWRQFFVYGLHLEAVLHAGWRNELNNPWDGLPIDSFQGRLWVWAGYQHELSSRFYLNLRGGVGAHMFRTDRFADREKKLTGGADLNLGFRFQ